MDINEAKQLTETAITRKRDELNFDMKDEPYRSANVALQCVFDDIRFAASEGKFNCYVVVGSADTGALNYDTYKGVISDLRAMGFTANYNVSRRHVILNVSWYPK